MIPTDPTDPNDPLEIDLQDMFEDDDNEFDDIDEKGTNNNATT